MALQAMASYPGCSGAFKPYAPYFPSEVEFRMGGTGLSGLALSDPRGGFPGAYADVMYVANPITRKVQAIKIHREGSWYRYEKLADFVLCSDEWFRPVAIHFGPDGCLYIVDWYNKIISHNEVPRTHPERDKTRGRIWRVKHKSVKPFDVPDFTKLPEDQLLAKLSDKSCAQVHLAWQAISDRKLERLAPKLMRLASSGHIPALWALEGLNVGHNNVISAMLENPDRNVRREALRAFAEGTGDSYGPEAALAHLSAIQNDIDPEVRAQIIRTADKFVYDAKILALMAKFALPSLPEPTMPSTHNGKIIKAREAYEREFQR